MILIAKSLTNRLVESATDKFPNESDHCFVSSTLIISEFKYGKGIHRCNATLLKNEEIRTRVEENLKKSIEEIPSHWNPHQKLDFVKVKVRDFLLEEGRIQSKKDKSELQYTNEEISSLNKALDQLLVLANSENINNDKFDETIKRIDKLKEAIIITEENITELRNREAQKLIFRSKAKWVEEGEKSTKYFLNLLKDRQKKMIIRKITSNGTTHFKQDEISKAIEKFYKDLYKKNESLIKTTPNHEFLKDLPKLDENDKLQLSQPITLEELKDTLKTCQDSAPGMDGITYDTYKQLWDIMGPFIKNAWDYSLNVKHTSPSQQISVITLLEKKDKDKSKIENLRPISLSNCDIKLCTKALAIRTNKVLHKLISKTQTGYVPGRQVNDNSRLLEEIIQNLHEEKRQAFLVTLDAQKAFDSVDHNYLLTCLKAYNFPEIYIDQVETIYTDLKAQVLVNGYLTMTFNIEQSVKQGDALSCALFILAIEPLLRQFQNNENIQPIIMNPGDDTEETVNNFSYADDITGICQNRKGIQEIVTLYEKFTKISGIKLNVPKTEIMILGDKEKTKKQFNIRYNKDIITITSQDSVKICGITFSNDKDTAYNENIVNKIHKMERQLNIWRQRNISLEGKILLVKCFGLSQLIYSLQATQVRPQEIKLIENIIYKFIWNIPLSSSRSNGKIRRETLQASVEDGGLNAPNVKALNDAIKYKHLLRCFNNSHPIGYLTRHKMRKMSFSINTQLTNNFKVDSYIQHAINAHNILWKLFDKDILNAMSEPDQNLHRLYYYYLYNHQLKNSQYINKQQKSMVLNLRKHGIDNFGKLKWAKEGNTLPKLQFEIFQIWNSFPTHWRQIIKRSKKKYEEVEEVQILIACNKWRSMQQLTTKEIRQRLQQNTIIMKKVESLNNKFNIHNNEDMINPFITCRTMTQDVKLRNVQYKILHNIYPTMKHLYTWKIKNSPNCTACQIPETISHAVWECDIAQQSINNIIELYRTINNKPLVLDKKSVIYGIQNKAALNTILTLVKRALILQREDKRTLTCEDITHLIKQQCNIEHYMAKKKNKLPKHMKKWHEFIL
jgi:hypothetical protein